MKTVILLQLEVKKLKKDHETELNIQLIELEAKLTKAHTYDSLLLIG